MPGENLPEGTDAIETGAGVDARDEIDADAADELEGETRSSSSAAQLGGDRDEGDAQDKIKAEVSDAATEVQSFSSRIDGLKGQAGDNVRDFVTNLKDRATDGIDDVVRMIEDAAGEVDAKIGTQYGDYIRRAGSSVSGLSDTLKAKDADALAMDAGDFIKSSPGLTVGAAAAIGFVVARLARAGIAEAAAAGADREA